MKVYRLCNKEEVEYILNTREFNNIGHNCVEDSKKNNHKYIKDKKYMHFFKEMFSLLYLYLTKGKYICVYNIPDDILNTSIGIGLYLNFINLKDMNQVYEYAIESEKIKFEYLCMIYKIKEDIDFEYIPEIDEFYEFLEVVYDLKNLKIKLEEFLISDKNSTIEEDNTEIFLVLIPEIREIIGFEHNHPHHHLDVWNHTLKVLENLNTKDLQINMAALLHDIGKPFSYQDAEIRHFHGHAEVSDDMCKKILKRLNYDKEFIENVSYLVRTHDTKIEVHNLDNTLEMIQKRLLLQYADAKAHHPDKVEKRIKVLDSIKQQLKNLFSS